MTPRKRLKQNQGLPKRWTHQHGAYYYRVPKGQEKNWNGKQMFRLGKTLGEAHQTFASRLAPSLSSRTVGDLLDRYLVEVVPAKAPATQRGNRIQIQKLRAVFGSVSLTSLRAQHAYAYLDKRSAKVAAKRELALLSHAFTKAIEWGLIDSHPLTGGKFRKKGDAPRTRYVEDWELTEVMSMKSKRRKGSVLMIQAYLLIKLLTGRRRSELLRLRMADITAEGLVFRLAKDRQGRQVIVSWSDELRAAVDAAKEARPTLSPYLFCNRSGECYIKDDGTASGWDSMWQRFMKRLIDETQVELRFTEHDIRAKSGSDAGDLERARQLLAHKTSAITLKVYRRRPEVIPPLR